MKIDVAGLHKVKAKGRTYIYAWRGGPRIHADPDSPEFLIELGKKRQGSARPDAKLFSGLIVAYRASPDWLELSEKTRQNWSMWLDRIDEKFGRLTTKAFDDPKATPGIRKWRDQWRDTPRSADVALQVMSRLLTFARAEGLISGKPCEPIKRLYHADRAGIIWTEEDMSKLEAVASPDVWRAARLASLTGLRQGALLRLAWSHIGSSAIDVPAGKRTGRQRRERRALVPLYGELRAELDAIPKRATTVLVSSDGRPWSSFGSSWQRAVKASGVDKHFHDFRGTAATRMHVAGWTDEEIAAALGWSPEQVRSIIRTYVHRDAILESLARRMESQR